MFCLNLPLVADALNSKDKLQLKKNGIFQCSTIYSALTLSPRENGSGLVQACTLFSSNKES